MSFRDQKISEFVNSVASNSPTPGGGAVGAITASMATALIEMVASLTIGKKGYEDYEAEMERIISEASYRRKRFLDLADLDAMAFDGVMDAMKLPKNTEEEKQRRTEELQEALKKASEMPYELAREISKVCPMAQFVNKYGNKNALSDAKSAAWLLKAAFEIAKSNVEINLKLIKDETFVSKMREAIDVIEGMVLKCLKESGLDGSA
ncbi:cyclodeaminase/cyclohydrolase family protein [Athalassotoga saccharophila]|uniref:cyclodeaminase/cyclohydrolase family protein n=1 Tax=Athalassotoga saccharophila TaxID=1441386 RepID=UPI0013798C05|nr:cyclodeaminase/cyclohydrolase family protein [Athalassotoga saccharophila]BBJ27337.1 formiminotransferase-cyclodeaminase [Athalassotoga saccharophila]